MPCGEWLPAPRASQRRPGHDLTEPEMQGVGPSERTADASEERAGRLPLQSIDAVGVNVSDYETSGGASCATSPSGSVNHSEVDGDAGARDRLKIHLIAGDFDQHE